MGLFPEMAASSSVLKYKDFKAFQPYWYRRSAGEAWTVSSTIKGIFHVGEVLSNRKRKNLAIYFYA